VSRYFDLNPVGSSGCDRCEIPVDVEVHASTVDHRCTNNPMNPGVVNREVL
jgi:hypothetical protein